MPTQSGRKSSPCPPLSQSTPSMLYVQCLHASGYPNSWFRTTDRNCPPMNSPSLCSLVESSTYLVRPTTHPHMDLQNASFGRSSGLCVQTKNTNPLSPVVCLSSCSVTGRLCTPPPTLHLVSSFCSRNYAHTWILKRHIDHLTEQLEPSPEVATTTHGDLTAGDEFHYPTGEQPLPDPAVLNPPPQGHRCPQRVHHPPDRLTMTVGENC